MGKKGYTTISFKDEFYERVQAMAEKKHVSMAELLEICIDESIELKEFAAKITHVPESVKVYT